MITGLFCGLVALAVTFCTKLITTYKFQTFNHLLEQEKVNELPFGSAYAFLFAINLIFGVIAWTMVFIEPLAGGSGRPLTQHNWSIVLSSHLTNRPHPLHYRYT